MNDRALHGDLDLTGDLIEHPWDELCPRCVVPMDWRNQSFFCPQCRVKMGCCDGS